MSRSSRRAANRRIPMLEILERRTLPAGNVTAAVVGDTLQILGDEASNQIRIVRDQSGGVAIAALDDTTINGGAGPVSITGPFLRSELDLGDGDDVARLRGFGADAVIDMGEGNDSLTLREVFARELTIGMGGGDDELFLLDAKFHPLCDIGLGAGDDRVTVVDAQFVLECDMRGGGGADTLATFRTHLPGLFFHGFETVLLNPLPLAVADAATVDEGASVQINLAANDGDIDSPLDLTSIAITQAPDRGAVVVNDDGTVTYTHDGSETTSDSFRYTIRDAEGAVSGEALVTITVTPVNDAPMAVADPATVDEGAQVIINLAGNDTDADSALDLTSIQITLAPGNGTVTDNGDGTVTYTHNGLETAGDSFRYRIKDAQGALSNGALVSIFINPVNDAPTANTDGDTVVVGGSKTIDLAVNDTDVDSFLDLTSIEITADPLHGAVTVNANGTVTYVHDGSGDANDSFSYTIKDVQGTVSNEAIVRITTNDPPAANDDADDVNEGASVITDVSDNDTDTDNPLDPTSIVITQAPANGTLTVNPDGPVTYAHNGSQTLSDSYRYTIKDALGAVSNEALVTITINPAG